MRRKEVPWNNVLGYLLGLAVVLIVFNLFEDMQEGIFVLVGLTYIQLSKLKQQER